MKSLFSPGKLLLTSEYFVLDGALALAIPTKLGQEFFFEEVANQKSLVVWEALHENNPWLKAVINYKTWEIIETNIPDAAHFISKILQIVQELSKTKFNTDISYYLETNLQFPSNFGLGSSSTLMNNLAEWSGVDAFQLNDLALGGSGYDIAIAQKKSPILFEVNNKERVFSTLNFNPSFKKDLIFIHLNQKQDSREGIQLYRSKEKSEGLIQYFSNLTKDVVKTDNIDVFSDLMNLHEEKVSEFLGIPTVKEKFFHDIPVFVKSLGAWGGDFVMSRKFSGYEDYFSSKNFHTIFGYNDLID
jgi:mevalonate kinase